MAWTTPKTDFAPGDIMNAAEMNAIGENLTVLTSYSNAPATYTPILAQGASTNIAKTVVQASYLLQGNLLSCSIRLTPTAGGSAGSPITVSIPSVGISLNDAYYLTGAGVYNDGGTRYPCVPYAESGAIGMRRSDTGVSGSIGNTPNFAVASSGDELFIAFVVVVNYA